jgi:phosphoribosylglycinamide formyltransferase-1
MVKLSFQDGIKIPNRLKYSPMKKKVAVAILIGKGSRLPAIIRAAKIKGSPFYISAVVSHKKLQEDETDVSGIALAKKNNIPAFYWNYVQMKNILGRQDDYRQEFEENLAAFLNQPYYKPDLVFMTGWLLVLSENFLKYFSIPGGYRVINVHPFWLPDTDENQEKIILPNGTEAPVLRGSGQEVIEKTLELKLTHTGITSYFLIPQTYDAGPVILRQWLKIRKNETPRSLRQRLDQLEDLHGPKIIELFAQGKLKIENGRVKIGK